MNPLSNQTHKLIELLSDGKFHSGEYLGQRLQVTCTAIWKMVQQLVELGIPINSVKGRGYQIPQGLELLNLEQIKSQLPAKLQQTLNIEVLTQISSTNQYLIDGIKQNKLSGTIVLAECQSRGRGRRNKEWLSPFGANIYLSLLWRFEKDPAELVGLSLAVAVAVANSLEKYGLHSIQLKWPNDVLWDHKKLAGILIDIIAESHSGTYVIIGVGLNVNMPYSILASENWIDIATITSRKGQRNLMCSYLITELVAMLELFQQQGFNAFVKHWQMLDAYYNLPVKIFSSTEEYCGVSKGINARGELIIVDEKNVEKRFLQGEVSLRGI